MNKKVIPAFVILQAYASILPANDIDRTEVAKLQQLAKLQIEQCADVFSNQRIKMTSAFDSIAKIFTTRYPEICVQSGLDWYKSQLTRLSSSQQGIEDQRFRANFAMVLSALETFKSDLGQKRGDAELSIPKYNTVFSDNLSTDEPTIPAVEGYMNLTGK